MAAVSMLEGRRYIPAQQTAARARMQRSMTTAGVPSTQSGGIRKGLYPKLEEYHSALESSDTESARQISLPRSQGPTCQKQKQRRHTVSEGVCLVPEVVSDDSRVRCSSEGQRKPYGRACQQGPSDFCQACGHCNEVWSQPKFAPVQVHDEELIVKVLVIGDCMVGKTSFVGKYMYNRPFKAYQGTVGGAYLFCNMYQRGIPCACLSNTFQFMF